MLKKEDLLKTTAVALSVAALAASATVLPDAIARAAETPLQIADTSTNPCNPCAAAANPCAANPCNPCAAKNPCAAANPCNPCAVANPCNPCAAANPCNPCAAATNPCNPCNPCAATAPKAASKEEEKLWGLIYHSENPDDYKVFLESHPDGFYAATARERIVELGGEVPEGAAQSVVASKIEALDATYVVQCNANVRQDATVRSSKIALLAGGKDVKVTGKVSGQNWYKVKTSDGEEGFVFGPLIRPAKISSEQAATTE